MLPWACACRVRAFGVTCAAGFVPDVAGRGVCLRFGVIFRSRLWGAFVFAPHKPETRKRKGTG
jgi:hypothetical protein